MAAFLAVCGCSSPSKESPPWSVVGAWEGHRLPQWKSANPDAPDVQAARKEAEAVTIRMTFHPNNTFEMTVNDPAVKLPSPETEKGTWTYLAGVVRAKFDAEPHGKISLVPDPDGSLRETSDAFDAPMILHRD